MAQTRIRREVMTTLYEGTRSADTDTGDVEHIEGKLAGAYTEKRLNSVLSRSNPGYFIDAHVTGYEVNEYSMSLEDFIRYATPLTK